MKNSRRSKLRNRIAARFSGGQRRRLRQLRLIVSPRTVLRWHADLGPAALDLPAPRAGASPDRAVGAVAGTGDGGG
jgi:hypothetical protein